MNNKEFIAELASRTGHTQDESQKMVKAVIDQMAKSFETGDAVPVSGFGTFEVKKRLERIVVNPATQQRMLVPPKLVLIFKPTASVKARLKYGGGADE